MVKLSERLMKIASYVETGERVADIGTDHGLLPFYLLENEISPHVVLCDINEGPMEKARQNANARYPGTSFDMRIGNGLSQVKAGEVDTVVIAGMGGKLIIDILSAEPEKTNSIRKFILQPRNAAPALRRWLIENQFTIANEKLAWERGRICEIIVAASAAAGEDRVNVPKMKSMPLSCSCDVAKSMDSWAMEYELSDEISPLLISGHEPLLITWIEMKLEKEQAILHKLIEYGNEQGKQKINETKARIAALEHVLEIAKAKEKDENVDC